jgi:hypothetical protein
MPSISRFRLHIFSLVVAAYIYIGSWRAPEIKEVREREEEKQTKERTMATRAEDGAMIEHVLV